MYEMAKLFKCKNLFITNSSKKLPVVSLILKKDFCTKNDEKNLKVADFQKSKVQSIKKYWMFRYLDYLKNYEKVLEKNFPKTMHVYRVFSVGTKDFYEDFKKYIKVRKKILIDGLDSLTREELQLSHTFPKDLVKITPVLLLSAVPFTNYIIFPLAFYFPHVILTSHYWSIQDKLKFLLKEQRNRIKYNKSLFRCLQAEVKYIPDPILKKNIKKVTAKLGSGTHPSVNEILACKGLFAAAPFSLKSLKKKHVRHLLHIHGKSNFGFNHRKRLLQRGQLIKKMDAAILREGGVGTLSFDAMRWALSFRGLNPVNMSNEGMQNWLNQWLQVSSQVEEDCISLLLHCPIFLAYNHETNWTLLYSPKKNL